ncbi:MAG: disulfide bond formation protein [Acidobacteria bacterium]|nr:MAG: disulfide bond formation protein [Acidobacteriota bacterium]
MLPVVALVALLGLTFWLLPDRGGGSGDAGDAAAASGPSDAAAAPAQDSPEQKAAREEAFAQMAALARLEPGDPLALGDVDAPVVLINYSEFQCPFCGRYSRETEPTLVEEYVDEGLLRIEWHDFPYLGQESTTAAHAGRAAGEQGAFWEFHEAIFADQPSPNSGTLTPEYLADVAADLGLDREQFLADLASEEAAAGVERDFQAGMSIGISGTPAFLVNGRPLMGAQPTETFQQFIDEALAEAGVGR